MSNDTAGIITILLDKSPPPDTLPNDARGIGRGGPFIVSRMNWGEGLEVAKMAGGICIFQAEMRTPKLRVQGVLLHIEGVNLSLNVLDEGVGVVILLDVSVEPPVFQPESLLGHEGVGV
jgi:hypothetical protein